MSSPARRPRLVGQQQDGQVAGHRLEPRRNARSARQVTAARSCATAILWHEQHLAGQVGIVYSAASAHARTSGRPCRAYGPTVLTTTRANSARSLTEASSALSAVRVGQSTPSLSRTCSIRVGVRPANATRCRPRRIRPAAPRPAARRTRSRRSDDARTRDLPWFHPPPRRLVSLDGSPDSGSTRGARCRHGNWGGAMPGNAAAPSALPPAHSDLRTRVGWSGHDHGDRDRRCVVSPTGLRRWTWLSAG